jgi:hypothetical protein
VIEGPVVKVYDRSFAVDDGSSSELVALRAPDGHVPRFGESVQVEVTPALHHVEKISVVPTKEPNDGIVQTTSADVDGQR